jgi:predicted nucleotidyltransferase/DNA-binding XRE family transcriptional regulator
VVTATVDSGALLREARISAGLSQTELAARAGVAQSVISVYESGQRQPSLRTLATLIEATGHRLDLRLRKDPSGPARLVGPRGASLLRNRRKARSIAASYGVTIRGVFGSVARGQDSNDSDIDLLVDLPPEMGLVRLGRLQRDLEALLSARVDLVPEADLKPKVRMNVLSELVPL